MKQCKRCGNKSDEDARYCETCGAVFDSLPNGAAEQQNTQTAPNGKLNLFCLFGFLAVFAMRLVTGFVSGALAIVLSAIGLHQIKTSGERGKGLGIAGLVIGICEIVLVVFVLIVWGSFGTFYR